MRILFLQKKKERGMYNLKTWAPPLIKVFFDLLGRGGKNTKGVTRKREVLPSSPRFVIQGLVFHVEVVMIPMRLGEGGRGKEQGGKKNLQGGEEEMIGRC